MPFYNEVHDGSTFQYWVGRPKDALQVFAIGYRRAAERVTNSLLRKRHFSPYEAYPVVFLYQLALELSLKHAIYKAAEFADYSGMREVENRLRNTHDLKALARALAESLFLLFPEDSSLQKLLVRLTTTTQELADIDPTFCVYRYPMDTKGRPASATTEYVNLRTFARHMSALLEDIDTLNFMLNAEADIAEDAFTQALSLLE